MLDCEANKQVSLDGDNTQLNLDSNKKKTSDVEFSTPQSKKQKTVRYPTYGRPLHLRNLKKKSSRVRRGGHEGRSTVTFHVDLGQLENQLCQVVVSPSKELEKAERCGLLGKRRGTTKLVSSMKADDV